MKRTSLCISFMLLAACTKGENAGNGVGVGSTPSGGTVSSVTPNPVLSVAPATSSAPVQIVSAAPASASDAGAATKGKTKPAKTRIEGKNFALDVASPGCHANEECAMTIKLLPTGDWHLNKEYPYKFIAAAAPGVTYLGKGDATIFSKATGDFQEEGEKAATMTVRFKPASPGEAKVSGKYKMSVCSAEQCQIEQQDVTLAVPVM